MIPLGPPAAILYDGHALRPFLAALLAGSFASLLFACTAHLDEGCLSGIGSPQADSLTMGGAGASSGAGGSGGAPLTEGDLP